MRHVQRYDSAVLRGDRQENDSAPEVESSQLPLLSKREKRRASSGSNEQCSIVWGDSRVTTATASVVPAPRPAIRNQIRFNAVAPWNEPRWKGRSDLGRPSKCSSSQSAGRPDNSCMFQTTQTGWPSWGRCRSGLRRGPCRAQAVFLAARCSRPLRRILGVSSVCNRASDCWLLAITPTN